VPVASTSKTTVEALKKKEIKAVVAAHEPLPFKSVKCVLHSLALPSLGRH